MVQSRFNASRMAIRKPGHASDALNRDDIKEQCAGRTDIKEQDKKDKKDKKKIVIDPTTRSVRRTDGSLYSIRRK